MNTFHASHPTRARIFKTTVVLAIIIMWSYALYQFTPSALIESFGISNMYIALFLLALFGGSSILFPFPYYILTISLGVAGLDPLLLGLSAGMGTCIGDSTTYYLASHGRHMMPGRLNNLINRTSRWMLEKHPSFVPIGAFCYSAFVPLSDDILMIPAGLMKYPFWRLMLGVFPGKVAFNTILALSGLYGWDLLMSIYT